MITEEQRKAIKELKELAILASKKVKHLRNMDIDVQMSINRGAVIINRVCLMREIPLHEIDWEPPALTGAVLNDWPKLETAVADSIGLTEKEKSNYAKTDAVRKACEEIVAHREAAEDLQAPYTDLGLAAPYQPKQQKAMRSTIAADIAQTKATIDPKQAREDVAFAQGAAASDVTDNPYHPLRHEDLYARWREGFFSRLEKAQ